MLVDREKATLLGLSTAEISRTVKAAISGSKLGVYREGKDEYDIVARLPEEPPAAGRRHRKSADPVPRRRSGAPVDGGAGGTGLRFRRHPPPRPETGGRPSPPIPSAATATRCCRRCRRGWRTLDLPAGYRLGFSGEQEEQQKASAFLGKAFLAAVFLISLVLVTQFNSLAQTGIVMTSVILSLSGVFLGLLLTATPFGIIMTGIGVISLAGVVVNNAIVLIDYINQLRRQGIALDEALVRAGVVRFRPVMLTAITTILGLLPMAVGVSFDFRSFSWEIGGESAQWWGPMAVAVIFGLGVATLLTLLVVPVLYSLAATFRWRTVRERSAAQES